MGISLLSSVSKLFVRIMLSRIALVLDRFFSETQNEFASRFNILAETVAGKI